MEIHWFAWEMIYIHSGLSISMLVHWVLYPIPQTVYRMHQLLLGWAPQQFVSKVSLQGSHEKDINQQVLTKEFDVQMLDIPIEIKVGTSATSPLALCHLKSGHLILVVFANSSYVFICFSVFMVFFHA